MKTTRMRYFNSLVLGICALLLFLGFMGCKKRSHSQIKNGEQTGFPVNASPIVGQKQQYPYTYITDLEGFKEGLTHEIEQKGLTFNEKGELDFTRSHFELVVGGDIGDRGPDSIKVRRWLLQLKKKYPDRVKLIIGNRDINKLILLDRWHHQSRESTSLLEFLQHNLTELGCKNCLELHRVELEELRSKRVTLEEAAKDYFKQLEPGGEYFEYVKQGEFITRKGEVLIVHGMVSTANYGVVPSQKEIHTNVDQWVLALENWGRSQVKEIETNYGKQGKEKSPAWQAINQLVAYGDSKFDVQSNTNYANSKSVVYSMRQKEDGNFRLPSAGLIERFKLNGVNTLISGHSPAGNIPLCLKGNNFIQVMADVSYSSNKKYSQLHFSATGDLFLQGRSGNGQTVVGQTSPRSNDFIGKLNNGSVVVGQNYFTGGYLSTRYQNDTEIIETWQARQNMEIAELSTPHASSNQELEYHTEQMKEGLKQRGVKTHHLNHMEPLLKAEGKTMVYFSTSHLASSSLNEGGVNQMISEAKALLESLSPEKFLIITGGTKGSVDSLLTKEALNRGFRVIATVPQTITPSEVAPHIKEVVIVGETWHDRGIEILSYQKSHGGLSLFLGDGPIVRQEIDLAIRQNLNFQVAIETAKTLPSSWENLPLFKSGNQLAEKLNGTPLFRPISATGAEQKILSFEQFRQNLQQKGKEVITFTSEQNKKVSRSEMMKHAQKLLGTLDPHKHYIHIDPNLNGASALQREAKSMRFNTIEIRPSDTTPRSLYSNVKQIFIIEDRGLEEALRTSKEHPAFGTIHYLGSPNKKAVDSRRVTIKSNPVPGMDVTIKGRQMDVMDMLPPCVRLSIKAQNF